jgi:thiosulfate dehydrogenase (quinone) large subunit
MHTSSPEKASRAGAERGNLQEANHPVLLGERSLLLLALVRLLTGWLWFQQLFWKMPPDFTGLHKYVVEEGTFTFLPGYGWIIQHLFLTHFVLLGAFTWGAELVVGLLLLFGVFSRLGALLSTILALQLYVGLAVAPGEWYWTYGMLVLLSLALLAVPAGRRLGFDQWLSVRFASGPTTRMMRVLRALV